MMCNTVPIHNETKKAEYYYEKYMFLIDDNTYVVMTVLSLSEITLNKEKTLVKKYTPISTYSKELPLHSLPLDLKRKLQKNEINQEIYKLTDEEYQKYAQLSDEELFKISPK